MVMRGEQRFGPDLIMQMLDDRPCQAQPVERAGAASNFVQNDQAAEGGVVEDVGGLTHLDHERRLTAREIVAGANAGENPVHEVNSSFVSRDKGSGMGEER